MRYPFQFGFHTYTNGILDRDSCGHLYASSHDEVASKIEKLQNDEGKNRYPRAKVWYGSDIRWYQ
jgi:hypothetical protein